MLKRLDIFKKELPSFNLRGKSKVASIYGGLLTIFMVAIICLYAGIKLSKLINRSNPNISSYIEEFKLTSDDKLNLEAQAMRFALTIEGYNDKEFKNDPRFVKFVMRVAGRKNSE